MTFKNFLSETLILEGGAAIKGSEPLTQAEAREITLHVIRDLKSLLKLPSASIAAVGSAGLKDSDQLSGDIDIAVEADVGLVKKAVEQLALDGRFKHMPGLNVYSYAKLHGSKVAQVDIIPTTRIALAKWAYHNEASDLKLGLKGSHRNELLFAIAKFADYQVTAKDASGTETARSRLVFDLSRGLYRSTQDRAGKRGIKKSFSTTGKVLVTSDPDKICAILFGTGVAAKQVTTFADALRLMLAPSFKHKDKLKQILDRAITGLESKKLVVPHELRVAGVKDLTEGLSTNVKKVALEYSKFDEALEKAKTVDLSRNGRIEITESIESETRKKVLVYQSLMAEEIPETWNIEVKKATDRINVKVKDDKGNVLISRSFTIATNERLIESYVKNDLREIFISLAKLNGFKYKNNKYKLELNDRFIVAHDSISILSVTKHGKNTNAYFQVNNLTRFEEALTMAKTLDYDGRLSKVFA